MKARWRVLLIAEAANPEWVSVPLVGWSVASALREVADVHLVTQVRNREAILRAGLVENRDFTAIDTEAVMKPLWQLASILRGGEGKGWTTVTAIQSLSYPIFERAVWKRFESAIKRGDFDLVHRVTPLSPTAPSLMAKRCARAKVPFVIGPLNGGVRWPRQFRRERHQEREWLSYIRSIYKVLPGVRSTWRNSSAIIAGSVHTQSEFPRWTRKRLVYIPENAVDPSRFESSRQVSRYDQLNLCYIGRLVPYKNPDIAIDAAHQLLREKRGRLTIIGDGPMMPVLRDQVVGLGIADRVVFTGWLHHHDVARVASQSSMFLFPSVREFGGGAVLEAMAMGLVPIVVNYGGPGEIVSDDTGFRIPLGSRQSITSDAARLLCRLSDGGENLTYLAANAVRRVRDLYTWEKKAHQILEVYDWVCGGPSEAPVFPFFHSQNIDQ